MFRKWCAQVSSLYPTGIPYIIPDMDFFFGNPVEWLHTARSEIDPVDSGSDGAIRVVWRPDSEYNTHVLVEADNGGEPSLFWMRAELVPDTAELAHVDETMVGLETATTTNDFKEPDISWSLGLQHEYKDVWNECMTRFDAERSTKHDYQSELLFWMKNTMRWKPHRLCVWTQLASYASLLVGRRQKREPLSAPFARIFDSVQCTALVQHNDFHWSLQRAYVPALINSSKTPSDVLQSTLRLRLLNVAHENALCERADQPWGVCTRHENEISTFKVDPADGASPIVIICTAQIVVAMDNGSTIISLEPGNALYIRLDMCGDVSCSQSEDDAVWFVMRDKHSRIVVSRDEGTE